MTWLHLPENAYAVRSKAPARKTDFYLDENLLNHSPSGDLFGLSQNVGMGWDGSRVNDEQVLVLSTLGGLRKDNGEPVALGYHTGHWELGLLIQRASEHLRDKGFLPFAGHCSDPCDGRTQGTTGMMDSLPYRNSACEVMGRLIRSLPLAKGVMGVATCDKGLPATLMALAENKNLPGIILPGGVSLPPDQGEDAGRVQSIGVRYAHGELTLKEAAELGCAACASPGGGCQFLGTAATSQVVAEAMGLALPHSALSPSGESIWLELATQSADALMNMIEQGITLEQIITQDAIHNALIVHAAFGGSSNLILHIPAIAHIAGLIRPTVEDWENANRQTPRLVDALPNGPRNFYTVQVFLAGGVPEVMLHLSDLGLLKLDVMTVTGKTLGENLAEWEVSERRQRFKQALMDQDGIDPAEIIATPQKASEIGLGRTLVFPKGNIAPQGSVVKSSAINRSLFENGRYFHRGRARVFTDELAAICAIKSKGDDRILEGDVIILLCRGPVGAGMPETAQITSALKYTESLNNNALITDGRFSGFSSGPCIGHVGPEAMAKGPIGKLRDGDIIEIEINENTLSGAIQFVGDCHTEEREYSVETGNEILVRRDFRSDLQADPGLPSSVKLWAAIQQTGGGTWGGCVPDVDAIVEKLLDMSLLTQSTINFK